MDKDYLSIDNNIKNLINLSIYPDKQKSKEIKLIKTKSSISYLSKLKIDTKKYIEYYSND